QDALARCLLRRGVYAGGSTSSPGRSRPRGGSVGRCVRWMNTASRGASRSNAAGSGDFGPGDLVRASCPAPLKTGGVDVGRVLVRASGSFDVVTPTRRVGGISWRWCQRLQQGDGYTCHQERRALPPQG